MKGIKKLFSLNLALILIINCLMGIVTDTTVLASEHQYEQYIIVDGVEYDATTSPKGHDWELIYDEQAQEQVLHLIGYNGGSIYTNVNINLQGHGDNHITSDDGYGIYVDGDLCIERLALSNDLNQLSVSGGSGHAAVYATGTLTCSGSIIATGGGTSALMAGMIHILDKDSKVIAVGSSMADAVEGDYTGQEYIRISFIPYTLTLKGNGGKTEENAESIDLVFLNGSPGSLSLYQYHDTFTNESNILLGWTENKDGSGGFYDRDEFYIFSPNTFVATLYAFWGNSENKGVTLNDYYDAWDYEPQTKVVPCKVGEKYTLPISQKPGCTFNGWRATDGELYPAYHEIAITDNLSFTAEYTKLEITVDGKKYDASVPQGSNEWGWSYEPYSFQNIKLEIFKNYSGESIVVPCNVTIELQGSLTGSDNQPAIYVDGDVFIQGLCSTQSVIRLVGGTNSSAVTATGNLILDAYSSTKSRSFILTGGEPNASALSAGGIIYINKGAYHVGSDENNLTLVGNYSGEHCLMLQGLSYYSVELSGTSTVPSVPDSNLFTFLGWYVYNSSPRIWYKPGDIIEAGNSTTLAADYLNKNDRSTIGVFIDGNGGRTSYGSNHYVHVLSSSDLALYKLPTSEFSYAGHTLKGYNSLADGTGSNYLKGGTVANDGRSIIYNLYAQWEKTPVDGGGSSGGGGGGGGGGGSSTAGESKDSFNNVIKKAETNGTVTLQTVSSDGRVVLTKDNVEAILAKNLNMTFETKKGSIQLTAEMLGKLVKENDSKEIEIVIEEKSSDNNHTLGGVLFDISVLVGGKENHNVSGTMKIHLDKVKVGDIVTIVHYNEDGTVKEVFFITVKELGVVEFNFDGLSKYTFMRREEAPSASIFQDIEATSWYENAVNYVYLRKLFDGTSKNTFSPNLEMNREMFVTVLYRLSGSPSTVASDKFFDVIDSNAYYYSPILWATENGIVNGYPDGRFGVGDTITREQMVAMLYRYNKDYAKKDIHSNKDIILNGYEDVPKDTYDAFCWAVDVGIIKGTSDTTLSPKATATRAQVAQLLMNYCGIK